MRARSSIAQAAEALGFRNIWLAEHHFSTYGYLGAPGAARDVHRGEDDAAARGHRGHRRAAAPSADDRRRDRHARPAGRRARRHRPRARLPALRVRAPRPRAGHAPAARWDESVDIILKALDGEPFSYDGKLFKIPETTVFPQPLQTAASADLGHRAEPESVEATVRRGFNLLTGGFGVPVERMAEFRKQFDRLVAEVKPAAHARGRRAARGVRHRQRRRCARRRRSRRAGTCASRSACATTTSGGARPRDPGAAAERARHRRPAGSLPGHRHSPTR